MSSGDRRCLWFDRYRLAAAFNEIQITLNEDDRGPSLALQLPPGVCQSCQGRLVMEDANTRSAGTCPVGRGSASLKSLLIAIDPVDPARVLRDVVSMPLSPALLDRLVLSASSRIGGVFTPQVSATALAARLAWLTGVRTAVVDLTAPGTEWNGGYRGSGSAEVVFLTTDGKVFGEKAAEMLEVWISRCQLGRMAMWISIPTIKRDNSTKREAVDAKAGFGKLSRQIANRVAKARDRHWSSWLSGQAQSRLLEVCDIHAEFDR